MDKRWISHLRRQEASKRVSGSPDASSLMCQYCHSKITNDPDAFREHVASNKDKHAPLDTDEALLRCFSQMKQSKEEEIAQSRPHSGLQQAVQTTGTSTDPVSATAPVSTAPVAATALASAIAPHQSRRRVQGLAAVRSRARVAPPGKALWNPEDPAPATVKGSNIRSILTTTPPNTSHQSPSRTKGKRLSQRVSSHVPSHSHDLHQLHLDDQDETMSPTPMLRQCETRPISQEQLIAEVKGIYAGLVMVETKCIEVDNTHAQNKGATDKLNHDQWRALIALHRTLLHEHHDFFLASQHPSASEPLKRLAAKYSMPARMWRHGMHAFLELLRRNLPATLDHMLTFIYLSYTMLTLLQETVSNFQDTWIECLGDIGRYRMAIEDDDIRDREIWTNVSKHWYGLAAYKFPHTGRLYHHMAILSRPHPIQQLFYYAKSMCVSNPFASSRESLMTLFEPVLGTQSLRMSRIDHTFVRAHAILFSGRQRNEFCEFKDEFLNELDGHISRVGRGWIEPGYYIGVFIGCSLLGYGSLSNPLMRAMEKENDMEITMDSMEDSSIALLELPPRDLYDDTVSFDISTIECVMRRWGDLSTLPFLHTIMVFLYHITQHPRAASNIENQYPWKLTACMLNHTRRQLKDKYKEMERMKAKASLELHKDEGEEDIRGVHEHNRPQGSSEMPHVPTEAQQALNNGDGQNSGGSPHKPKYISFEDRVQGPEFPHAVPKGEIPTPLPEDHAMQGLIFTNGYFDDSWFTRTYVDDGEKYFEQPSMVIERLERILWLGHRIAANSQQWLTWDAKKNEFDVNEKFQEDLDIVAPTFPDEPMGEDPVPTQLKTTPELTMDNYPPAAHGTSEQPAGEPVDEMQK